jgi:hypothetical protein
MVGHPFNFHPIQAKNRFMVSTQPIINSVPFQARPSRPLFVIG